MPTEDIIVSHAKKAALLIEFDEHELVIVVFEAMLNLRRPDHVTTAEAYAQLVEHHPQPFAVCSRIASAALDYIGERCRAAKTEPLQ